MAKAIHKVKEGVFHGLQLDVKGISSVNNNNIFISYIKYTNITPPANSKANRGRWCEDGLRFITIVEVKKKDRIYNKEGQSREKLK